MLACACMFVYVCLCGEMCVRARLCVCMFVGLVKCLLTDGLFACVCVDVCSHVLLVCVVI